MLLLIPATLGLIGVTSMLMELVADEIQLPRKMQIVFTIVGITLAIAILLWSYNTRDLDYSVLVLVAPVICALHFVLISKTIHTSAE